MPYGQGYSYGGFADPTRQPQNTPNPQATNTGGGYFDKAQNNSYSQGYNPQYRPSTYVKPPAPSAGAPPFTNNQLNTAVGADPNRKAYDEAVARARAQQNAAQRLSIAEMERRKHNNQWIASNGYGYNTAYGETPGEGQKRNAMYGMTPPPEWLDVAARWTPDVVPTYQPGIDYRNLPGYGNYFPSYPGQPRTTYVG